MRDASVSMHMDTFCMRDACRTYPFAFMSILSAYCDTVSMLMHAVSMLVHASGC